ncbi:hypothetical protein SV7mr_12930 [Stieleria bergensis]|uniref:Uncharacterized protein n=1 Tax=Stieleria bergensis TaxID=2528025 RepID=A0A517SRN8_9BACT|nr:hypothetical protein SV7mr_12930 [Planctomycetes bacterium SV_7m_r]
MNTTERLFARFETSKPSWWPVIVLSLIGSLGTITAVTALSQVQPPEPAQTNAALDDSDPQATPDG